MKIEFYCNSGANAFSCRKEVFTIDDLGMSEQQWDALSDDEKYAQAEEWANDRLEIGWKEL